MKKVAANSPEGKKLMDKYKNMIMQNGGIAPEEVLSGSVVTGVAPNQPANVEVEGEEFIQTPEGNVTEVAGKPHTEGGEKLNLPEGSKILSDNIKIGKEMKKMLEEEYNVNLKANTTFAQAHDKIKNKLGITDAEEEQENYLNLLAKNKEIEDEGTQSVNEQFLAKKIRESEQKLQLKKSQESAIYNTLFEAQGKRKQSKEDVQVEETYVDEEEVPMAQDGGVIIAQNGTQTRRQILDANKPSTNSALTNNATNFFQLPPGKFEISELTPAEKQKLDEDIAAWVETFKASQGDNWINALNSVSIVSGSSQTPVSIGTRNKLGVGKDASQKEANIALANKRAQVLQDYFKSNVATIAGVDPTQVNLAKPEVLPYAGPAWDAKKGIKHPDYQPYQNVGIKLQASATPTSTEPRDAATVEVDQQTQTTQYQRPPEDVLGRAFPIATPYRGLPNPLMTTQLNLPDAEMVTPIKVSPEEAIRENNRGFVVARDVLSTIPGASVGANIANLLGQTQNVNNQAVAEANRQNAQYAMQAQNQNQQVGANLSQARTQAMDIFGKENLMALDNTLNDIRNWQSVISTDQINAQREGRQLNMLDAMSPEYSFDMFGNVVFTDTNRQFFLPQNSLQGQLYNGTTQQPAQDPMYNQWLQYMQANQPKA